MPSTISLKPMTFTVQQSRQQIIKNILNSSKSKSAWTFSRQVRFRDIKTESRNSSQQKTTSSLNKSVNESSSFVPKNYSYGFGKSKRKIFTEKTESPSSWKYNPEEPKSKTNKISLPLGRQKCINGSYISKQKLLVPGPANYEVKSLQKPIKYTMRPKTGHQRTYFIENKQAQQIPGPGKYLDDSQGLARKSLTSKFRDSSLGISGIRSKSNRFKTDTDKKSFISTNLYDKLKASWSKGCPIGSQKRLSFIEITTKLHDIPGPGNYELPSQFGHYRKLQPEEIRKPQKIKL